ncbi:MAG: ABC transporter ATP-binding protein [Candidatus Taylorbacteria bacterium]|nr:ABC transporter ATP-binding protein [Candidatus Taylorbacteria bacterium]
MRSNFFAFLKAFNKGFGEYKFKIILLACIGFISALLEGVGINAFIPIFSLITKDGNMGDDVISKTIAEVFGYFHIEFRLKYLLVFVVILFLLKTLAVMLGDYISIRITADYTEKTRRKVLANTMNAGWPYLLKQQLGHLNTVILTNIEYCELLLNNFGALIVVVASLFMYIAVAINISLPITLLTMLVGMMFLLAAKPLLVRTRRLSKQAEAVNRDTAHHISENLIGMKTVKAMGVENKVIAQDFSYFATLKIYRIKASLLKFLPPSLMQPLGLFFVMGIFAFAYRTPNFNLAAMAAVVYFIQQIFLYVQKLQRHVHVVNDCYPYFKSITDFTESAKLSREDKEARGSFKFSNILAFDRVNFSYDESRIVLDDVSFEIKRGEMIGLIGPSGAGKTTVVDLLLRLFKPIKGKITLDNVDAENINLDEWRQNIGYVPQDMFLMNDTISNNIRFYDNSLTDDEIKNAAKSAHIDDFISQLDKGYETIIGERGIMISAGQRQRIIIARVLVRKPNILILDEATSALDNESESRIQKVIDDLRGKLTVVVIAHRLSTIMNTDKIIVLDGGRIVETGTPDQLLKDTKSYFYNVNNLQV